jgi:hypothetical protein
MHQMSNKSIVKITQKDYSTLHILKDTLQHITFHELRIFTKYRIKIGIVFS